MIKEGTKIIDFSLVDQDNIVHKLSDYSSGRVLLYFYPKDDTPGCTKEACMITELYDDFKKQELQFLVFLRIVLLVIKSLPRNIIYHLLFCQTQIKSNKRIRSIISCFY